MKRVEVEWLDSMTLNEGRWLDEAEAQKAASLETMRHFTCGYLVHESKDAVIVAASRGAGQHPHVQGAVTIPRVAIESLKVLRAG